MKTIEISNLSKYYGDFRAVDNISLSIGEGEIVGFVGKNGAGKSTTIRAIMNFITPSSGTCKVCGKDSVMDSFNIREFTGYMPSDSMFPSNITCLELFDFCRKISNFPAEKIVQLAEYFELDLNKNIGDLSLGNRKKVSIIQALIKENKVLILDEPTSGLDPLMQERFFNLLLKEKKKAVTIFLSSHNLSEIEKYCDRAIIIKDGKIIDNIDLKNTIIHKTQLVTYTTKDGKSESFEHDGDPNLIIQKLAKIDLVSVEIKNKSVEDEFIKYYKEDEKNA